MSVKPIKINSVINYLVKKVLRADTFYMHSTITCQKDTGHAF